MTDSGSNNLPGGWSLSPAAAILPPAFLLLPRSPNFLKFKPHTNIMETQATASAMRLVIIPICQPVR